MSEEHTHMTELTHEQAQQIKLTDLDKRLATVPQETLEIIAEALEEMSQDMLIFTTRADQALRAAALTLRTFRSFCETHEAALKKEPEAFDVV